MIRGTDGRFKVVSWHDALAVVAEIAHQFKPEEIVGIAAMMALKDFLNKMGSNNVWCEGNGPSPNADLQSGYIMNRGISGLENADVFLLVGTQVIVWTFLVIYRTKLLDFSCALSRPDSRIHDQHIGKVPLQGFKPMRTQTYIQSYPSKLNQSCSTRHK
ncbi:NADH dehydrogenase [Populus alba x Populus x berolinensis]|uniref:NADH dehydrogenase n=1 Tax=Populus alba x Populus x berolinensis TaxID=444605 RepID=A0AAD6PSL0_9ROSI|nr:NADH dehydrogenase [Populus alba x Populus x berolinensis]